METDVCLQIKLGKCLLEKHKCTRTRQWESQNWTKRKKRSRTSYKATHLSAVGHEKKYLEKEVLKVYKLLPRNASFKIRFTMLLVTKLRFYHYKIFKAGTPNRFTEV